MKNNFWQQSASAGLIIGALSIAAILLGYMLTNVLELQEKALLISSSLLGFFKIVILFTLLWNAAVRYARSQPEGTFSVAHGMGFIVMVMVFAGFLSGIGYYIQFVKLQPDYISDTVNQMLQGKEETAQFTKQLLSSAAYWIMIAMFQMAFYGVIYGVFIAYFVRRRLAAIKDYQDNDSQETENNSDETIQ
jgi:hypothetical protein